MQNKKLSALEGHGEDALGEERTHAITQFADELMQARIGRRQVSPLSERAPQLTIEDAYQISLSMLQRRLAKGDELIGKKIGVTSEVVQRMLGVHQPDFGFLTRSMQVTGPDIHIVDCGLIAPRAEAEIGLILGRDLPQSGVTNDDVLEATAAVVPCFEIVDSRIRDWKIGIIDTIADNASCGVFVLGEQRVDPRGLDLATLHCRVLKNGEFLSEGLGSAVQGSPLASVAWLANTLGAFGVALSAGDIILSGSLVPLEPAAAGDEFEMTIEALGSVRIRFI